MFIIGQLVAHGAKGDYEEAVAISAVRRETFFVNRNVEGRSVAYDGAADPRFALARDSAATSGARSTERQPVRSVASVAQA